MRLFQQQEYRELQFAGHPGPKDRVCNEAVYRRLEVRLIARQRNDADLVVLNQFGPVIGQRFAGASHPPADVLHLTQATRRAAQVPWKSFQPTRLLLAELELVITAELSQLGDSCTIVIPAGDDNCVDEIREEEQVGPDPVSGDFRISKIAG